MPKIYMGDLMNLTKREKTGLYVFGAVILILISFMYYSNRGKGEIKVNAPITPAAEDSADSHNAVDSSSEKDSRNKDSAEIKVYICGAVCNPGVYTIFEGDRIDTLLKMAGGATEEADLAAINLAERLQDEQYVRIPAKGEENGAQMPTSTGPASSQSQGLININTATAEELDSLPGIGPAIAARIIAYREEKGKFTSIEQIKEVSGIGESKYQDIKDKICVK